MGYGVRRAQKVAGLPAGNQEGLVGVPEDLLAIQKTLYHFMSREVDP